MSDWFPPESLSPSNDLLHPQDDLGPDERPAREGLPPSYQMRHDRHFVDELDSRSPAALIRMVPTKDIKSPGAVDLVEVAPLVESVREVGVLQPLLVRRRQLGYELIAGARRFAAATAAGLTELPCRVYNVGEQEARALAEADDLRLRGEIDRPPPIAPPHASLGPALPPRLALPAECHGPDLPSRFMRTLQQPYLKVTSDHTVFCLVADFWTVRPRVGEKRPPAWRGFPHLFGLAQSVRSGRWSGGST